jgi:hypothetical protein
VQLQSYDEISQESRAFFELKPDLCHHQVMRKCGARLARIEHRALLVPPFLID